MISFLDQVRSYDRLSLRGDLTAGLTVAVMLIPQGMAYALIAGLPPIYGLYAALVPIIVYALLGTSRQLAVGPVAMVSLLVAAGVAPLAEGDAELYIGLALLLSLLVGVIQFVLGLARFGFLTNFLSHPVLSGFTSAAALIIGFSQLKNVVGIDIPRSNHIHVILIEALQRISEVHITTAVIGVGSIVFLVLVRRWSPKAPGALVLVALATAVTFLARLHESGVAIVGDVPGGLPIPIVPPVSSESISALLPAALAIALVGFMESIAVAKVYATKHRYDVDANKELIGLGLANIAGAFFRAYPTTGGFSRTAVNDQAGARTNVAALVSALIIAVTLLFLTDLFTYLPKAVLGAIVMVAVFNLIDWKEARFLWKVDRLDFFLLLLTFAATLVLGIEEGILVGVVASLVVVVHQASRPHTAIMGRLPGTETYRNLERHPEAIGSDRAVVFRMDASLFFANVAHLKEKLRTLRAEHPEMTRIILDFYPVNRVDSTGVHALGELLDELRGAGSTVYFAGVKGPVMDKLKRSGLAAKLGTEVFYDEVHDAVVAAEGS